MATSVTSPVVAGQSESRTAVSRATTEDEPMQRGRAATGAPALGTGSSRPRVSIRPKRMIVGDAAGVDQDLDQGQELAREQDVEAGRASSERMRNSAACTTLGTVTTPMPPTIATSASR